MARAKASNILDSIPNFFAGTCANGSTDLIDTGVGAFTATILRLTSLTILAAPGDAMLTAGDGQGIITLALNETPTTSLAERSTLGAIAGALAFTTSGAAYIPCSATLLFDPPVYVAVPQMVISATWFGADITYRITYEFVDVAELDMLRLKSAQG